MSIQVSAKPVITPYWIQHQTLIKIQKCNLKNLRHYWLLSSPPSVFQPTAYTATHS